MRERNTKQLLFVALAALILMFSQCEKLPLEQDADEHSEYKALFERTFNSSEFDSVVPFDFKVNWEVEKKGYSDELESTFYEYPIELKEINEDNQNMRRAKKGKTIYKLIAVSEGGQQKFYILKLYGSASDYKNVNWANKLQGFSGLLVVTDNTGKDIIVNRVQEGERVGEGKEISAERLELIKSGRLKMAETCYTEIIYHYIHWYQQNPNGTWDYLDSQYLGSSSYEICYGGTGGGGGPIGGGTGGGSTGGDTGEGDYQDCPDTVHGCYHDVEDKLRDIKIADSFEENECLSSVYSEAGGKSTYQNILQNFDGEFSVAHLTLSAGTNVNGNAVTKAPSNYNIEIMFNTNRLNRPKLSVARTLMHELVHAEMFRKLLSVAQAPDLNYPGYTLEDWRNYVTSLKDDYPGLYDYYLRYEWGISSNEEPTSAQHQLMAEHYREMIEDALREFDGSLSDEIYEALAWQGLKNTVAWNELSYSERNSIDTKILNFRNSNSSCQ